jgi:hypothetical protein
LRINMPATNIDKFFMLVNGSPVRIKLPDKPEKTFRAGIKFISSEESKTLKTTGRMDIESPSSMEESRLKSA